MTGVWSKSTYTNMRTRSGNPHVSPEHLEIFCDGSIRWKASLKNPAQMPPCLLSFLCFRCGGERMRRAMQAREEKKHPFYLISSLVYVGWFLLLPSMLPLPTARGGFVCFYGQCALLRAGGRTNRREGLRSNGWLEKAELALMSWKQSIPLKPVLSKNTQPVCSRVFEEYGFK